MITEFLRYRKLQKLQKLKDREQKIKMLYWRLARHIQKKKEFEAEIEKLKAENFKMREIICTISDEKLNLIGI